MNIFEINEDSSVVVEEFMGSKIYYIDNFLKNPDNVVNFLDKNPAKLHHPCLIPSHFKDRNGSDFLDARHNLYIDDMSKISEYLSNICGQTLTYNSNQLMTNVTKFFKTPFNDYENNYWWPHTDGGYTALIYLNKNDKTSGTNLYKIESEDENREIKYHYEHSHPWRSKKHYSILKTIEPKYNHCVLFDGLKFVHGMNIESDRYFNEECRRNIVCFFRRD